MDTPNNNAALIEGLRKAADFLESRPDFPELNMPQHLWVYLWKKEDLPAIARHIGSCSKEFSDNYFKLIRKFSEAFWLECSLDRESICKKIVTWECPDDESILKMVVEPAEVSDAAI